MHTFTLLRQISDEDFKTIRDRFKIRLYPSKTSPDYKSGICEILKDECIPMFKLSCFPAKNSPLTIYLLEVTVNFGEMGGSAGLLPVSLSEVNGIVYKGIVYHILNLFPKLYAKETIQFKKQIREFYDELKQVYDSGYETSSTDDITEGEIVDFLTALADDKYDVSFLENMNELERNDFEWELSYENILPNKKAYNLCCYYKYVLIQEYGLDISYFQECISKSHREESLRYYMNYVFYQFKLDRIDYCLDIYTDYKSQYMALFNRGLNPKRLHLAVKHYNNDKDRLKDDKYKEVSVYFKGKSIHVNAYDKLDKEEKLIKSGSEDLSDELKQRIKPIFRIEVQVLKRKMKGIIQHKAEKYGYDKMKREFDFFANTEIKKDLIYFYIKEIIGTGNYFTKEAAENIIRNSNYTKPKQEMLKMILELINDNRYGYNGFMDFMEKISSNKTGIKIGNKCVKESTIRQYVKDLQSVGINPVRISNSMFQEMKKIQVKMPVIEIGNPILQGLIHGKDYLINPLYYIFVNNEMERLNEKYNQEGNIDIC